VRDIEQKARESGAVCKRISNGIDLRQFLGQKENAENTKESGEFSQSNPVLIKTPRTKRRQENQL